MVIIDGNNLLHAMHAHAPIPNVGRETLLRVIEKWARRAGHSVSLVFDGPTPPGNLAKQMSSKLVEVTFSAPKTADDVIVDRIHRSAKPDQLRVVTGDGAIAHEARARKCQHVGVVEFIRELFPEKPSGELEAAKPAEKPLSALESDVREWEERLDDEFGRLDEMDYR